MQNKEDLLREELAALRLEITLLTAAGLPAEDRKKLAAEKEALLSSPSPEPVPAEKPEERKLQLYVWEGVFCDYSDGVAFALAGSADEARALIALDYCGKMGKVDQAYVDRCYKELAGDPRCVAGKAGFLVCGGG